MLGQIRSYISYMSPDSDQSFFDRIKNMIYAIEDEKDRATLLLEYTNKLNEINIIRKYNATKEKKEEVIPSVSTPVYEEEPYEEIKSFEEEIEEKIKEWQAYEEQEHKVVNRRLPDIYASAFNLIKVFKMKPRIYKSIPVKQKASKVIIKNDKHNMPSIPIYE